MLYVYLPTVLPGWLFFFCPCPPSRDQRPGGLYTSRGAVLGEAELSGSMGWRISCFFDGWCGVWWGNEQLGWYFSRQNDEQKRNCLGLNTDSLMIRYNSTFLQKCSPSGNWKKWIWHSYLKMCDLLCSEFGTIFVSLILRKLTSQGWYNIYIDSIYIYIYMHTYIYICRM